MLTLIANSYHDLLENKSDQRVKNWLFMSSPVPTLVIIFVYLVFVTKLGPKLMENRKPFILKNVLMFYNIIQVIFSAYLFYQTCTTLGWLTDIQWFCQLPDYSMSPRAYAIARGCWHVYLGKLFDLLDTIFFVLRKKSNQISNLHIFHHVSMAIGTWVATKFIPGGSLSMFVFINSFIHMVMYAYYFLAALGPQMQKYLWWKRYLTQMQIIQFIIVIVHDLIHLFIRDCAIPKVYPVIEISLCVSFLLMFLHFYRMEYLLQAQQLQKDLADKRK